MHWASLHFLKVILLLSMHIMYVWQHAFHNVCGAEYNLEPVLSPLHGFGGSSSDCQSCIDGRQSSLPAEPCGQPRVAHELNCVMAKAVSQLLSFSFLFGFSV